ncbi:opine metallophore biosynthesis dehydrogenase [Lysinibacillus capsici]|uniref:opine metallophore biosynthesis dehydrogenase n=1 Tax=Lysinibacillus capsici TaxID=2115968 RepID=UPI002A814209|nr:opine metallophore biosynthesis dehydrogenase [Lysinibacillus capsici]
MLSKDIVSSLHIAKVLKVTSPMLDHFVQTYAEKLLQVVALSENQRFAEAFEIKSFSQEIEMI